VIGIGGSSGAGKSALCLFLSLRFSSHVARVFHQDHYFRVENGSKFLSKDGEYEFNNIEHPWAVDFDRLEKEVIACKEEEEQRRLQETQAQNQNLMQAQQATPESGGSSANAVNYPRLILVEGFLLYSSTSHSHPLHSLFDLSLFIEADHDSCFQRRLQRSKLLRCNGNGSLSEAEEEKRYTAFFQQLTWPAFILYNRHVLKDSKSAQRAEDAVIIHSSLPSSSLTASINPQFCPFDPSPIPIRHLHFLSGTLRPSHLFHAVASTIAGMDERLQAAMLKAAKKEQPESKGSSSSSMPPRHCACTSGEHKHDEHSASHGDPTSSTMENLFSPTERRTVIQRVQASLVAQQHQLAAQGKSNDEIRQMQQAQVLGAARTVAVPLQPCGCQAKTIATSSSLHDTTTSHLVSDSTSIPAPTSTISSPHGIDIDASDSTTMLQSLPDMALLALLAIQARRKK